MIYPNKNYEVQITCRFCHKSKIIYLNFHPEQGQIKYTVFVCCFCGLSQKIVPVAKEGYTQYILRNLKNENKMAIRNKHEGLDTKYVSYKDIDDGSIGDSLIVNIAGEGELNTTGQYGNRWMIPLSWEIKDEKFEKNINLSKKNENQIIDLYGEDTKNWINKSIKLVVSSCDVGKSGKMIEISDKRV